MTRDAPAARDPQPEHASGTLYRCECCDRVIPGLADDDLAVGLDARLGLVSDACALICSDCTARLIDARLLAGVAARRPR
jgi:hypothetical protein